MNLANKITIMRVLLIPVYAVVMYIDKGYAFYIAGAIFITASLTDTLDGYIARKYNMITDFGKFLDPLADKLLVLTSLIIYVSFGRLPAWTLIVVMFRELIITSLRSIAALKNHVLAADVYGKLKTIFQLVALSAIHFEVFFDKFTNSYFSLLVNVLYMISVALTIISGVNYLVKNKSVFEDR